MDELEQLRDEIDQIDREMTRLFEKRMEIVDKVAQYKKKNNIPILNTSREEEVLEKNITYLQDKTLRDPLREFFISLMKISKDIQRKNIE